MGVPSIVEKFEKGLRGGKVLRFYIDVWCLQFFGYLGRLELCRFLWLFSLTAKDGIVLLASDLELLGAFRDVSLIFFFLANLRRMFYSPFLYLLARIMNYSSFIKTRKRKEWKTNANKRIEKYLSTNDQEEINYNISLSFPSYFIWFVFLWCWLVWMFPLYEEKFYINAWIICFWIPKHFSFSLKDIF